MSKVWLGLLLGAALGAIDGLSAGFYPFITANDLAGIVVGSTFKGLVTGVVAGWYARRSRSVAKGVALGLVVGLVLSYAVAAMGDGKGNHYYVEIMLPGTALGAIVGFATQRYGAVAPAKS
jgi:LytS/YehU family sensor histidine kinase